MKSRGFTLIELLILVAIVAIIAAIVIPNLLDVFLPPANNETITNEMLFLELASQPITSLNASQLTFMVDYSMSHISCPTCELSKIVAVNWWAVASVYQNQIIINEVRGQP
jgi:prepilin-type N-terminal cleavage/methylation domain-containing protein